MKRKPITRTEYRLMTYHGRLVFARWVYTAGKEGWTTEVRGHINILPETKKRIFLKQRQKQEKEARRSNTRRKNYAKS